MRARIHFQTPAIRRIALFLALAAVILGAKFQLIDRYGSDLPYWDQWDAEGDSLLRPYGEGTLKLADIFGPHNEHRPALTRVLTLGLFEANGRVWDARVQMIANTALHAASALLLLSLARRFLPPAALFGFAALLAVLFGQSISWENTLAGFQSQFYFILLFSALHLGGTLLAPPRSLPWWLAPLAGIAALFSMASGLLSALAIIAVVGARALRDRRLTWEDAYAVLPNALFCVAGWLLKTDVPGHVELKAHSLGTWLSAFLHQYSWPVIDLWAAPIGMLPAAALALAYFRRRIDGPVAQVLLAACTWFMLQAAALAYGRGGDGTGAGSRYVDTLCIGVAIHLLTVGYLAYSSDERGRWRWLAFGGVSIVLIFAGVVHETRFTVRDTLNAMPNINEARIFTVRNYLASRDPVFFQKRPWDELPYPEAGRLAKLLEIPALRQALPPSVRPPVSLAADETATRGFVLHRANSALAAAPRELPVWSSAPGETARFVSAPFATEQKRIAIFAAGEGAGKNQLYLVDERGRRIAPSDELPATPRWKRLDFSVSSGRHRIEVEHHGPGWFAFTAPVTDAPLSHLAQHIPRAGAWLLAGAALLGIFAWRQTGPPMGSAAPSWPHVGCATLALGFALALTAGLHRQIFSDGRASDEVLRARTLPQVADFALFDSNAPDQPGTRFAGAAFVLRDSASGWFGTYVGGDGFTGRVLSTPFPISAREMVVPILGYPNSKTNRLTLEILDATQQPTASVDFTDANPTETPALWRISTAQWQGRKARLVLLDGDTASRGWLAVGAPTGRAHDGPQWMNGMERNYGWFVTATMACAGLLFLPGLALRTWWPARFPLGPALLALPGLFGLVAFGLCAWIFGARHLNVLINAWLLAHVGVAVALARTWWRNGGPLLPPETTALAIYATVVVGALAFGVLPLEVAQESGARSTHHARMIASPPDHAIPYQTAAYFFHGNDGREKSAEYFGESWSVASRGPLAALAITGTFALFDAHPKEPPGSASDRWPAADDGFYLARIVGILTNALVILAALALIARLAPAAKAAGLAWLAVAPAIAINTDFLWPKLLATFFFLVAVRSAIERRSALRLGVWSALAYLSHPVGGLFLPLLALFVGHLAWSDPAASAARWRTAGRRIVAFVLAVLVCIAPWLAFKAWVGGHDVFMDYPLGDGRGFAHATSVATWLHCRWSNLWLTLVPFGFYFSDHMGNWLEGPLSEPLRWAIGYAKTLPGALGFAGFGVAAIALVRRPSPAPAGFRRHLLLGAFVFALIFWGFSSDGLGRNCLEPLAVLFLVYAVAALPAAWSGWRWVLLATALETLSIRVIGVVAHTGFSNRVLDLESVVLFAIVIVATLAPALWFFLRRAPRSDERILFDAPRIIVNPVLPPVLAPRARQLLALALFFLIWGVKLAAILQFGSDLPVWDQLPREGALTYVPWVQRQELWSHLFESHNEHRIAPTLAINLALIVWGGQWDGLVQCLVNAAIHAGMAVVVFLWVARHASRGWAFGAATVLALITAPPIAYENLLIGFQSQFYFLIGFSLLALHRLIQARVFSAGWWLGAVSGGLALVSMGSGLLAAAPLGVVAATEWLRPSGDKRRATANLILAVALIAAGGALHTSVSYHAQFRVQSVGQFITYSLRCLAWPLPDRAWVGLLLGWPWLMLAARWIKNLRGDPHPATDFLIAAGGWVLLQIAAVTYSRAALGGPAVRYGDVFAIGIIVSFVALIVCAASWPPRRRWILATVQTLILAACIGVATRDMYRTELPRRKDDLNAFERVTRAFVLTNDTAIFERERDRLPFPDPVWLTTILRTPEIRRVLPSSVAVPLSVPGLGMEASPAPPLPNRATRTLTAPGEWRSAPLPASQGWWKIETAGDFTTAGVALTLVAVADGRVLDTIAPTRHPGNAWRLAYVSAPREPAVLVARITQPQKWIAFSEPVPVSETSYRTWRVLRNGKWIALAGGLLALGALAVAWRDPGPTSAPTPSSRLDWPVAPPPARPAVAAVNSRLRPSE